ncbi:hypothetical protein DAI22_11g082632 [Oryza sativa Japonica Group]|nr:hypothetical protein DAI22_11g082632 [Oryza sativa Japonica Group]
MQRDEACDEINRWVAAATENLIKSIVSPDSVDKQTRLVVTSAIYFKGKWATPFDKETTKNDKFHLLDGGGDKQYTGVRRRAPAARHVRRPACSSRAAAATASSVLLKEMAMTSPTYSMCIFLPDERDGLRKLEDRMAAAAGGEGFLWEHMPERRVEVGEFRIPRFKLSFPRSLTSALQGVRVKAMFGPAAELPDMLEEDEPPRVSDVAHKALIEVNEEGTEAAAATAMLIAGAARNAPPPPPREDFVADHPFAFFVVEESSHAVLFAGHVVDPTKSE